MRKLSSIITCYFLLSLNVYSQCNDYSSVLVNYAPIAGTGTYLNLGDDQLSGALPIGFSFDYYCGTYTNFYISSNGFITFDAGAPSAPYPQIIPNTSTPNNLIAANWTDLDPSFGGQIHYRTTGTAPNRKLIVNFDNVSTYWGGDYVTVQTILTESSNYIEIQVTYATSNYDLFAGDDGVTIGIEGPGGTLALDAGINGATGIYVQNQAIQFIPCTIVPTTSSLSDLMAECSATPTAPTATSCNGTITGTPDVTFPITTIGTTVVTWAYNNGAEITYQSQNVTITDGSAPVPTNNTLPDINELCEVTSLIAPSATDNCAGTITGSHDAVLPITSIGTTVVTWTYDDGNGNTSTQTQNVVISGVDVSTNVDGINLSALNSNGTYVWVDCDNNYQAIAGETGQNFTATVNGNFAVIVTEGICVDTSDCMNVNSVGLENNNDLFEISIYPIPASDFLNVELINGASTIDYSITDMTGRIVLNGSLLGEKSAIDISNLRAGRYQFVSHQDKIRNAPIVFIVQ